MVLVKFFFVCARFLQEFTDSAVCSIRVAKFIEASWFFCVAGRVEYVFCVGAFSVLRLRNEWVVYRP